MNISIGRDRQREIYLEGFSGKTPKLPVDPFKLESKAKSLLSRQAFDYIYTGAGNNEGVCNNLKAFKKYCIQPRMLTGHTGFDLSTVLLGTKLPVPILFAPVGVLELAHPRGDLELAEASKVTGIPMIQSNQASFPMEACSEIFDETDHWFQLYFSNSKKLLESFVQRAMNSGNKAIVLTLDTTSLGWRTLDLQNGYLPFLQGRGIAQYTSDPVFREMLSQQSRGGLSKSQTRPGIKNIIQLFKSYPDSVLNNIKSLNPVKAVRTFLDVYSRPELNWEDVKWLRSICKIPLLLKGILHPDDAMRALDSGIDGIIISNHGGRQVDRVISSLDALVLIKKQVPKDYPLLLDGGIRTGSDVYIGIALGAQAVCLGRPVAYALAIAGKRGVQEYIQNLTSEFQLMLSLTGVNSYAEFSSRVLRNPSV